MATADPFADWDAHTASALEDAYVAGGAGPRGSGSGNPSEGDWRAKRQHLAVPMDQDGDWLDIGCANGHLLRTLPSWVAEREVRIEPYGLELLPRVAELARSLNPELADRIWTGSVMTWEPPRRFRYVTALVDAVPPAALGQLIERLIDVFLIDDGRLIISAYANRHEPPRPLATDLTAAGWAPDGTIDIDRPGRHPLRTAWIDR